MASSKVRFTAVCLIAIIGGVCVLALQIVTAATKAWVTVTMSHSTFSFGLFNHEATAMSVTLSMANNGPVICLQAMVIFSVGFASAAIISTALGITRLELCHRGTLFFVKVAEACFVLSAILYLIGISVFTHFWIKDPKSFFDSTILSPGASYDYGYAYILGWFVFFLQVALVVFVFVGIHGARREHDTEGETEKLVDGAPVTYDDRIDPSTSNASDGKDKASFEEKEQGDDDNVNVPPDTNAETFTGSENNLPVANITTKETVEYVKNEARPQ